MQDVVAVPHMEGQHEIVGDRYFHARQPQGPYHTQMWAPHPAVGILLITALSNSITSLQASRGTS